MTVCKFLPIIAVLALGACTTQPPISANPVQDITTGSPNTPLGQIGTTIGTDLQSAEFNLDQAILVGALPANDPADACLHGALTQIGLEPGTPAAPSFAPKNDGLVSLGAIAYIRIQQLKKAQGGVTMPGSCKEIIGQFVLDGAAAGKGLSPGGNLLPTIQ